ncbi:5'-methylthioadenosine/S-adenosylhomocysteine nucleosidase, partial [Candidatus Saccharibacteria bacterium]|nr:5'-methylthioadenosine/S-adenosylhomocysteine nucleosidase [Candidatus Saccharibacteria bacterium]
VGCQADVYEMIFFEIAGHKVCLALSGFGEIAAASCTQYLIDHFNVNKIINYGVVGSLVPCHAVNEVGFVRKIIHYDLDLTAGGYAIGEYPKHGSQFLMPAEDAISDLADYGLKEFICASGGKFIDGAEDKSKFRDGLGADICEMEAAGIVITCNRNKIPCSFIKSISDGADEGAEAFEINVYEASRKCAKLIHSLLSGQKPLF